MTPPADESILTDDDLLPLLQATASRALDTCLRGARGLAVLGDLRALGLLLQLSREEDAAARAEVCRALAALDDPRAADRLRSLLFDLRPSALDNATLEAAIRSYLEHVTGDGPPTWSVTSHLEVEPPVEVRLVVFRIAQEAVANVLAHASATHIAVSIDGGPDTISLTVGDDGCGFDPSPTSSPGHLGVVTMRERAEQAGGSLRIASSPGAGTIVRALVPVRPG